MKIHKVEYNFDSGFSECGLFLADKVLDGAAKVDNTWKHVTCKRCLKLKKKRGSK